MKVIWIYAFCTYSILSMVRSDIDKTIKKNDRQAFKEKVNKIQESSFITLYEDRNVLVSLQLSYDGNLKIYCSAYNKDSISFLQKKKSISYQKYKIVEFLHKVFEQKDLKKIYLISYFTEYGTMYVIDTKDKEIKGKFSLIYKKLKKLVKQKTDKQFDKGSVK